jgi:ketosteroid isomerase-like protein
VSTPRRISLAAIILAVILSGSLRTAAAQQPSQTSDTTQIIDTVKSLFAALSADDLSKFELAITREFYMFDGGERFTGAAIMGLIKTEQAAGKHYEWNITQPDVHITGDTAWIAYVNDGSVTDASGTIHRQWLESAFLRKEAGTWKIAFFHSTRVPPPQPK